MNVRRMKTVFFIKNGTFLCLTGLDYISGYLQSYLFLCRTRASARQTPQTAACLRLQPSQSVPLNISLEKP